MRKIRQIINNEKLTLSIILFVNFAFVLIRCIHADFESEIWPDGGSYFIAANSLQNFHLDSLRTPIYPAICLLSNILFNKNAFVFILFLQYISFFISIIILNKTCSIITQKKWIKLFATILYAWNPSIICWIWRIQTESLSMSFVIVLAYFLAKLIHDDRPIKYAIVAPLWLFVMIMLKPFFLCFTPIILITICYVYKNKKNIISYHILSSLTMALLLTSYCYEFKREYGSFTLSYISTSNKKILFDKMNIPNNISYWNVYKSHLEGDSTQFLVYDWNPSLNEINEADSIFKSHITDIISNRYRTIIKDSLDYYPDSYVFTTGVPLFILYLILIISTIHSFSIKNECHLIYQLSCLIICYLSIFTCYAGAPDEVSRLLLPIYPLVCIIIAMMVQSITSTPLLTIKGTGL